MKDRLAHEQASAWHRPSDLLIQILIHEREYETAWHAVRDHGASANLKERLARESEATHPSEALAIYTEHVEALVGMGGNSSYEEAVSIIARIGRLRSTTEQAAYVADIKARHRRKRNFMRLLA